MIHTKEWPHSKHIEKAEYNDETQEMDVTFLRGATYRYFDVPEAVWQRFIKAESAGSFFTYSIRGDFKYRRL